ncbi:hypothetical protein HMPREF9141_0032 [Prevotella multiformis DSM 16608]|uniref:Uncharacterized protein n=1 Tax=Prevotella multiformis DSM 16608 TaxID=888743 RepID=F0F366_9BACT|nr:hypothetical protein HMPREF9141_0032 [Prevotella multiformis DSM 16608]
MQHLASLFHVLTGCSAGTPLRLHIRLLCKTSLQRLFRMCRSLTADTEPFA